MGYQASQALKEPAADPQRPLAAVWRRAAARAIDAATVFFLLWALVVLHVLWFMDDASNHVAPRPWGRGFVATVTFVVLAAAYEVLFLTRNQGRTPGKDILKIRVQPLHGDRPLGRGQALARWALPGLAIILPPLWVGALVAVAVGAPIAASRRRAVHDLLARTVVVAYDPHEEREATEDRR
jgi:uncharacterized RDD family membrane protein YckC